MKHPRYRIQSTTSKIVQLRLLAITVAPHHLIEDAPIQLAQPPTSIDSSQDDNDWAFPPIPHPMPRPNFVIDDKSDPSEANIFAFGAFANKNSGIVYHHDLTGLFPFMSLDGSVCFFILYHYKSNCILADPIKALDDKQFLRHMKKNSMNSPRKGSSQSST